MCNSSKIPKLLQQAGAFFFIVAFWAIGIDDRAFAMTCPSVSLEFNKIVSNDMKKSLHQILSQIVTGQIRADAEKLAEEFFLKYANSVRPTLADGFMSIYCQTVEETSELSESKKYEAVADMEKRIAKLVEPSVKLADSPPQIVVTTRKSDGEIPRFDAECTNVGGDAFNIERRLESVFVVYAGQCQGKQAYPFGFRSDFVSIGWRADTAGRTGAEVVTVSLRSDAVLEWLAYLDAELKRSNSCVEAAALMGLIEISYSDTRGGHHVRYFLIEEKAEKLTSFSPNGALRVKGDRVDVKTINKSEWERYRNINRQIQRESKAVARYRYRTTDDERMNIELAARHILNGRGSLKHYMGWRTQP